MASGPRRAGASRRARASKHAAPSRAVNPARRALDARRAARPAPARSGRPRPPACAGRRGRRSAAAGAVAARRDGRGGRSRRAPAPAARRAGCAGRSSPHNWACVTALRATAELPFRVGAATTWIKASPVRSHRRASRNTREKRPTLDRMPANQAWFFRYQRKLTPLPRTIRAVCGRRAGRARHRALWGLALRPAASGLGPPAPAWRTSCASTVRSMRILITGPSGAVGAALARSLAGSPRAARPLPRPGARWTPRFALELVRGDALTRGRARARAGGRRGLLLPDPLDGAGAPTRASSAATAPPPCASPPRPQRAGVRRIVYLGGLRRRRPGARSVAPREPRRGRADPARRRCPTASPCAHRW